MNHTAVRTLLVLGLLFLAACSSATPTAAPTPDLGALRTEVAATVLAQVPQLCALTPTATFPATATTQPTATIETSPTQTITATTVTPVAPTATNLSADKAKFVAQSVPDGAHFAPGQEFVMTWTLQNTGQTTWTTNYRLRFFAGNLLGAPKEIPLEKEVKPGEKIDIGIQMKAPNTPGDYRSDWVMSNAALGNFKEPVYLTITVSAPPTATKTAAAPTVTKAPTATVTPQP